jgi:RHS repeat-associated protein
VAEGTLYHLDPDHLGTPRLATDGQGVAVWRWEGGEPFGAQAPDEDPGRTGVRFVLNLRFPGQYYDAETQLHYNYFRDYDPATGRYVQSDPIGLAGGINTYGYVGGNPINVADPNGLWAQFAIGGVVGGIAGAIATGNTVGWSWNNAQAIAIGAGVGAVTGVAGAYSIGQGLLAYTSGALIGGAGGFSGNVSGQLVGGTSLNCVDWRQAGFQGFTGLVAGMAAGPAFGPLPVANPAIAAASLTGGATLLLNSMTSTGLGGFGYAGVFR